MAKTLLFIIGCDENYQSILIRNFSVFKRINGVRYVRSVLPPFKIIRQNANGRTLPRSPVLINLNQ